MSIEEIKSEIELLTSKSISELIEFAIQIRDQRDSAAAASLKREQEEAEAAEKAEKEAAAQRANR